MHKNPNAGYRLTASYLEIYNEQVSCNKGAQGKHYMCIMTRGGNVINDHSLV